MSSRPDQPTAADYAWHDAQQALRTQQNAARRLAELTLRVEELERAVAALTGGKKEQP